MSGDLDQELNVIAKRAIESSAAYNIENIPDHFLDLGGDIDGFFTENDDVSSRHGTRASILIDRDTKEISYAISGTRTDQGSKKMRSDLYDDLRLAVGFMPKKMESLEYQNQKLITRIKEAARLNYISDNAIEDEGVFTEKQTMAMVLAQKTALKSYKFNFTGHSLGAALSDCAGADMYLRLKNEGINPEDIQISSTTFDNPGAKTAVKNILKKHNKKHPESKVTFDELRENVSYKAINNSKNFINTMDRQIGEKYRIMPNADGKDEAVSGFVRMCKHIANKCKNYWLLKAAYVAFSFLSFGRLTKQIESHSIENFQKLFSKKLDGRIKHKGVILSVDDIASDREPIQYEEKIFDQLKNQDMKVEEGSPQQYVMVNPNDPEDKVVASASQIRCAHEAVYGKEATQAATSTKSRKSLRKFFRSKFPRIKTKMGLLTAKDVASGEVPSNKLTRSKNAKVIVGLGSSTV